MSATRRGPWSTRPVSKQYINERYLPDKAIDLIDEEGLIWSLYPKNKKIQVVDKKLVEEVLAKI